MKLLKGFVSNYAHPEGSIAQRYIAVECVRFCETFIKQSDKSACDNVQQESSILEGHPLSAGECIKLNEDDIANAHRYVLFNLAVIEPYFE